MRKEISNWRENCTVIERKEENGFLIFDAHKLRTKPIILRQEKIPKATDSEEKIKKSDRSKTKFDLWKPVRMEFSPWDRQEEEWCFATWRWFVKVE